MEDRGFGSGSRKMSRYKTGWEETEPKRHLLCLGGAVCGDENSQEISSMRVHGGNWKG